MDAYAIKLHLAAERHLTRRNAGHSMSSQLPTMSIGHALHPARSLYLPVSPRIISKTSEATLGCPILQWALTTPHLTASLTRRPAGTSNEIPSLDKPGLTDSVGGAGCSISVSPGRRRALGLGSCGSGIISSSSSLSCCATVRPHSGAFSESCPDHFP